MFNTAWAKLTAYFAVFLVVSGGLLFVVLDRFVLSEFERIERDEARVSITRAMEAIRKDGQSLRAWSRDISPWDDTYRFIETRDMEFIAKNFPLEWLDDLEFDLLLLTDNSNAIVWGYWSEQQSLEDLPYQDLPGFADRGPEWDTSKGVVGLHRLGPDAVYLLVVHPILTSEYGGPSRGATVFGRRLDNARLEKLAESSVANFELQTFRADTHPVTDGIEVTRVNGETIAYTVLHDFNGAPVLTLKIRAHKDAMTNGTHAISAVMYVFAALAFLGFVFFLLLVTRLRRSETES